jgi:hypothetical protein
VGRFTDLTDALAQPSANFIVAHDIRTNRLWTIRGTTVTAVPLQSPITGALTLGSISRDGHTLSFSQPGTGADQRTGVVDLQSGAVPRRRQRGALSKRRLTEDVARTWLVRPSPAFLSILWNSNSGSRCHS